jgi:phosphoglycerol transferase MdoB-like AlkP superfamily enzyme
MMLCGFLLGAAGQVVKLCADTAMQIDVDDALRGHVFTVQDSLFWMSFIVAIALAATVIPADGHQPALALAGVGVYLAGLAAHAGIARSATRLG